MKSILTLITLGFLLLLTGAALPFLMVISLLEPTFFLTFLSYFLTITGLGLGFIGIAHYLRSRG